MIIHANSIVWLKGDLTNSTDMLMVVIYMLIVVGLFFLIIRIVARKNRYSLPGRTIRSIGGAPLGQNKSVQIIEIGGIFYILGVGENVTLLAKVEDPLEAEMIRKSTERVQSPINGFPTVLQWLKDKRKGTSIQPEEQSNFGQIFQDRMDAMKNRRKSVEEWMQEDAVSSKQIERQDRENE
ncbi:MAG: flagellar biosynthetic protein FliO [Gorillibacterium sp.]|nr:flagellar biosynthetic protein FliO [Gorillibacterium sp.]